MGPPASPAFARLSGLSEAEREVLAAAFSGREVAPRRSDIIRHEDAAAGVALLLKGCACASVTLPNGRRQIVHIILPGDFCDLARVFSNDTGLDIRATTVCTIARASGETLRAMLATYPSIALALWERTVQELNLLRTSVACIGQLSAPARTAHLLCEIFLREREAGLCRDGECPFTLTQADLAEALGLSVVQVNRILQDFRAAGFLSLTMRILQIKDFAQLASIGEFSPTYLPNVSPLRRRA